MGRWWGNLPFLEDEEGFDPYVSLLVRHAREEGYVDLQEAAPIAIDYRKPQPIIRWTCYQYQREQVLRRFLSSADQRKAA